MSLSALAIKDPEPRLRLQVVPFYARHIPLILPSATADMITLGRTAERSGHGFTGCVLGDPIGAAGIITLETNVGQAWAIFTPFLKQHFAREMYRLVKSGLEEEIKKSGVKSVIAFVDPNDATAVRFIEHLGFHDSHRHQYHRDITGGSR